MEDVSGKDKKNPNFPLQPYASITPMKSSNFIFEISTEQDKKSLIDYFQNKDYVSDTELIAFISENAPGLKKYFHNSPILIDDLKNQVRNLFGDVPDYLFEGGYLDAAVRIINHIIRKETANFIIDGIATGKLLYDDEYYPLMYSAFYRVSKLNFHIESYQMIIELWEQFLENQYWKAIFAESDTLSMRDYEGIAEMYNFLGRQYTEFIERLNQSQSLISKDVMWAKRTTASTVPAYWSESSNAIKNITKTIDRLKVLRNNTFERKQVIEKLLSEKKSIRKDQIETLMSEWGLMKYMVKKIGGVFK